MPGVGPKEPAAPHAGTPTGGTPPHSPTVPSAGGHGGAPPHAPAVPSIGGGTAGAAPSAPPAPPDFGPTVPAGPSAPAGPAAPADPKFTPAGGGPKTATPAHDPVPTTGAGGTTMEFTKPAGGAPAAVPEKTPTTSYDVDIYHPKPGDTYESISREFYNDTRYASALQAYNRNRQAQGTVDVPPLHIVKRYTPGTPADATPTWGSAGGTARTTGARTYTVPQGGMSLATVAKSLLGSEQRWRELYDLNPQVTNPSQVPAGTELKLPTDARNPG
jgi:LysM repeat protein